MDLDLTTTAALKRAMRPGATLRIVNHRRPQASRLTVVLAKTNTVDLVTQAKDPHGNDVESHLPWPKAKQLSAGDLPNTVNIADETGQPFLTVTVLEEA